MPLPPPRDHSVTIAAAAESTKRYRDQAEPTASRATLFHRAAVDAVLAQTGCVAVRLYYGRGVAGEAELVMVGVDGNGNDLTGGAIMDIIFPCPPYCGIANPLNP
ncbi:MAG: hypothetical protein ACKVZ0_17100 [Gemmatimonadales bacterium]